MLSHLYPLCYNFSCFYSFCIFPYVKFCSIINCLQELLYCFKPSRHLSLFHNLLLPPVLSYLLCCLCCNLCCSLYFYSVALLSPTLKVYLIFSTSLVIFSYSLLFCLLHPSVLRLKHGKNRVSFLAKKSNCSSCLRWTTTGT